MSKRIDLDEYFQLRVATILRMYLPHSAGLLFPGMLELGIKSHRVSLLTVGRLTVLTYMCGRLAHIKAGQLRINGTNRVITPGSVDQKLRAARVK